MLCSAALWLCKLDFDRFVGFFNLSKQIQSYFPVLSHMILATSPSEMYVASMGADNCCFSQT